ncbi:MAG: hypothetical protein EOP14_00030 [Pseudomonas sp.]|nr:MAG: hypothetical protein EOP14_00030 [Pseudomonas sp.]
MSAENTPAVTGVLPDSAAIALHAAIVNIPVSEKVKSVLEGPPRGFYLLGHRDARHAASELVLKAIASLQAAAQDDARDAARYRFLRANDGLDEQVAGLNQCHWDKVIDAAMTAVSKGEQA